MVSCWAHTHYSELVQSLNQRWYVINSDFEIEGTKLQTKIIGHFKNYFLSTMITIAFIKQFFILSHFARKVFNQLFDTSKRRLACFQSLSYIAAIQNINNDLTKTLTIVLTYPRSIMRVRRPDEPLRSNITKSPTRSIEEIAKVCRIVVR